MDEGMHIGGTGHGKSYPEVQEFLRILREAEGQPDESKQPLIDKYMKLLIRDPHDPLAAEILSKLPDGARKLIFDNLAKGKMPGYGFLDHRQEDPPDSEQK